MNKYKIYEGDSTGYGIFTAKSAEQALADYIFIFDIKNSEELDIKVELLEEQVA